MKTLNLDLGNVGKVMKGFGTLQADAGQPAGWYVDPRTGAQVYYDPDSQTFYTMAGGVYIPLGYMNPAPKQVAIGPGEKLLVTVSYKYSGPAVSGAVERFVVGTDGFWGFSERLVGENTRNLPASITVQPFTSQYTFTIPVDVGNDWTDIYCKVSGGTPGVPQTLFGYKSALVIAGKDPVISEFTIVDFAKV